MKLNMKFYLTIYKKRNEMFNLIELNVNKLISKNSDNEMKE